jgi:hypothetical protein
MSHDPESIRRLTQSYRYLRGYSQIPLALLVLALGANRILPPLASTLIFLVVAALAIPTARALNRYYDRRFGVVKASGWGAGPWTLVVVTFFVLQLLSGALRLPVQLGFLGAGIALAAYALRHLELEKQRLLLAAFFLVLGVSPQRFFTSGAADFWSGVTQLGFVAVWIVMALWDHQVLVKAFERTRLVSAGPVPSGSR